MLKFDEFGKHQQGTIALLLYQSYEQYFQHEPNCESVWKKAWEQYDRAVFSNPDTVGACGFVADLDGQPVGFASWDPRPFPVGVIGHNGVLPQFRGNSYGKQQIKEVLRVLRITGFVKVRVTTGGHQFFELARSMYRTCGFQEVTRGAGDECSEYGMITYEIDFQASDEKG